LNAEASASSLKQRALALARHGRHGNLDDREKIAFSRVRFGEAAPASRSCWPAAFRAGP